MSANKTKPGPGGGWLLGLAAIAVVALVLTRRSGGESKPAPVASTQEVSSAAAAASSPYQQLAGRWLRPDGGYILDLKWVGADGKVEAAYLNPRPIHVSRAEASRDGDRVKLLVELQDTGYPGCVYTLFLDPGRDVLAGSYYQAAMQETFQVEFTRTE